MSRNTKNDNIAEIVKQLDTLSIGETEHILQYVNGRNRSRNRATVTHRDRNDRELRVGDRVVLLTKGVDNRKYEEATVKALPKTAGGYLDFIPERFENDTHPRSIRKLSTSVRKINRIDN